MRWATCSGVHSDRAAGAWLVRRQVDADAESVFVDAPGLDVILRGLSMTCDDARVMELTGPVLDGLHEYYRRAFLLGRPPA